LAKYLETIEASLFYISRIILLIIIDSLPTFLL